MTDYDITPFAFPATVLARASQTELLERARARASDPAIFDDFPPFFWSARISTDKLDAYFTHMMPSSLRNYATEADAGVAFQDSHKTDGLARTLGYSLTGKYSGPQGNGIAHTDADFYTLAGLDAPIDTFIRKMRGGIARDVSIGFYGGQFICSICGRDMLTDWDCWHYPGLWYEPRDDEGRKVKDAEKVMCTAAVEGAHLAEVSTVYDGATPGAVILKAQQAAADGRLRPETARLLEAHYRIALPGTAHGVPGIDLPKGDERMPEPHEEQVKVGLQINGHLYLEEDIRTLVDQRDTARAIVTDAHAPDGLSLDGGVRWMAEELARLRPLADDGTQYREDWIEHALREGVRAYGAAFAVETHRALLQRASLEEIKTICAQYSGKGDASFPGGRHTVDADEREQDATTTTSAIPDAAYRTRR